MKPLKVETEEPPGRPRATSRLLIKPQSPINALAPAPAPSAKAPRLDAVVVRMERFPIGPVSGAFRKRYYRELLRRRRGEAGRVAAARRFTDEAEEFFALPTVEGAA